MKEAYYFSHDSNASQDPKILEMCSVYKAEGYGWYWMLVEMMRDQESYKIDISGKYTLHALAMRLYTNHDAFASFINDCVDEFKLFARDDKFLWSESLIRRMQQRDDKSEKARKAAEKRWGKSDENTGFDANALQPQCDSNAIKERKGKEKKGNEIKVKEKKEEENILHSSSEAAAIASFENNIHPASPIEYEKLNDWMTDIEPAVVICAIEEAVNYNKRSMGYINAILNNWLKIGITTSTALDAYKRDKADEKNQSNSNSSTIHPNVKQALDLVKKYEDMEREQGDDS